MPVTGKYNLVQLNSIYFTKDGLVTGKPCKTQITGLDALKITTAVQVQFALDGTPYLQTSSAQKGLPVGIKYDSMQQSVFDDVVTEIQSAVDGSTSLSLSVTGDTGSFSLALVPAEKSVVFSGDFNNGQIQNGSFNFLTT